LEERGALLGREAAKIAATEVVRQMLGAILCRSKDDPAAANPATLLLTFAAASAFRSRPATFR
jgi:hypothetical protein